MISDKENSLNILLIQELSIPFDKYRQYERFVYKLLTLYMHI